MFWKRWLTPTTRGALYRDAEHTVYSALRYAPCQAPTAGITSVIYRPSFRQSGTILPYEILRTRSIGVHLSLSGFYPFATRLIFTLSHFSNPAQRFLRDTSTSFPSQPAYLEFFLHIQLMMAQISVLSSLRVRLIITFMRLYTRWIAIKPLRRDQYLAQSKYSMRRKRVLIPSRDPGRHINADLYLPPQSSSGDRDDVRPMLNRPILVNYHGSAFVLTGLLGSNVLYCARIAHELGIVVLDADYRRAPEHPFPAAIHDVEDVLRWVSGLAMGSADSMVDKRHRQLALSGFSSGGSLALAAASVLRVAAEPPIQANICAVLGIYPSTNLVTPPEDKKPPKEGIGKSSPEFFRICLDCYVPDEEQRKDPLASPGLAKPEMYPQNVAIFTCEGDALAPEGISLAKRLQDQDDSRYLVSEMLLGVPHGFDTGAEQGTLAWERREDMYATAVEMIVHAVHEGSLEKDCHQGVKMD